MQLSLYQRDASSYATRVRILCYAKNIPFTSLDPRSGGSDYLVVNPIGKIPCLNHDGFLLPESEIICEYLEEVFPTPALLPTGVGQRALVRLLSRLSDLYISPAISRLLGQMNTKVRDPSLNAGALEEVERGLQHLDAFLEGPDYAVGDALSIADCVLAPALFSVQALAARIFEGRPSLPSKIA